MSIVDTPEKREISKEEALDALQTDLLNSLQEVNELLPNLGHGEAKRLLIAALSYPLAEEDFSQDLNQDLRKAYNASKRVTDAKIALGVEVTLEAMLKQKVEEEQKEGENNG